MSTHVRKSNDTCRDTIPGTCDHPFHVSVEPTLTRSFEHQLVCDHDTAKRVVMTQHSQVDAVQNKSRYELVLEFTTSAMLLHRERERLPKVTEVLKGSFAFGMTNFCHESGGCASACLVQQWHHVHHHEGNVYECLEFESKPTLRPRLRQLSC